MNRALRGAHWQLSERAVGRQRDKRYILRVNRTEVIAYRSRWRDAIAAYRLSAADPCYAAVDLWCNHEVIQTTLPWSY